MLAGLVLAGCSSLDPTGLLDDEAAEPEQVDAGQAETGEAGYPDLGDVPDEPKRRPSGQQERKALADSLAADRDNARYSDEALRSPEAAPEQATRAGDRGSGASGSGDRGGSGQDTAERSGATAAATADGADSGRESRSAGSGAAGTAASTGQAVTGDSAAADETMPDVPDAPSETRSARETARDARTQRDAQQDTELQPRASQAPTSGGDQETTTAQSSKAQSSKAQSSTGQSSTGQSSQTAPTTAGSAQRNDTAGSAENRDVQPNASTSNGAVQINRSQIPQIQPSRDGEPVQLPGEVQRRVDAAAGAAQRRETPAGEPQTARLQSPPSSADQVGPRPEAEGSGTRVAVIYFSHGAASLNGQDRQVLRKVAKLYERHDGGLRVVGHASSRTATMDMIQHRMVNLDTSMRRAETVADVLVRYGVPRGEIKVEARSDRDPAYHEFMPTGEAGNRRAEIFLGG
jgi:outer membrane protein OmpA-like peptidoglycan-associated protein